MIDYSAKTIIDNLLRFRTTTPIRAEVFGGEELGGGLRVVSVVCSDHNKYALKGPIEIGEKAGESKRLAANHHIAGALGHDFDQDVFPRIAIVEMPRELRDSVPELEHIRPGLCHGSRFIDECPPADSLYSEAAVANRRRFAKIAVFQGWCAVEDRQYLYCGPSCIAYAVDNGNAFTKSTADPAAKNWNGSEWNADCLDNDDREADVVDEIRRRFKLTETEIHEAASPLKAVSIDLLCERVAAVPSCWNLEAAPFCWTSDQQT